jgi:hypothetical protein
MALLHMTYRGVVERGFRMSFWSVPYINQSSPAEEMNRTNGDKLVATFRVNFGTSSPISIENGDSPASPQGNSRTTSLLMLFKSPSEWFISAA